LRQDGPEEDVIRQPDTLEEEGVNFFEELEPSEPMGGAEFETPPEPELPEAWEEEIESRPEVVWRESAPRKAWRKYFWGLDIGVHSIKLIGLRKVVKRFSLVYLCLVENSPQKALLKESEEYIDLKAAALMRLLEGLDLERNSMVSCIGSPSVVIRQIEYPTAARSKLLSALRWEIRRYIPFKPDEVVVDAQILAEPQGGSKMDVLLTAVTKEHLSAHLNLLEKVGIKPILVDAAPLAVLNAYSMQKPLKEGEVIVLLDMGASCTCLNIYGPNSPFFTLSLSVGGYRFTREIQSRCRISYVEAEALKCRAGRGGDASGEQSYSDELYYTFHEALQTGYDLLISEIRQALIYYNKQTGINKFDRLVLCGGGALLPELPEYLSRKLGVEVEIFNPFEGLEVDPKYFNTKQFNKFASQFAVALGLALREASQ